MRMLLAAGLLLSACATDQAPGLLVLDEGARERGYELVIDDTPLAPSLPVESGDEVLVFTDEGDVLEIEVELGEVVRIDADDDGMLLERAHLGWDVDGDSIVVLGEEEGLDGLMDALPADMEALGDGDSIWIEGAGVVEELAWLGPMNGVRGVILVELEAPSDAPPPSEELAIDNPLGTGATGLFSRGSASVGHGAATGVDKDRGSLVVGGLAGLLGADGPDAGATAELDRRLYTGFYLMEGKEVALSMDGGVRYAGQSGEPFATWSVDAGSQPVVLLGGTAVPVTHPSVLDDERGRSE